MRYVRFAQHTEKDPVPEWGVAQEETMVDSRTHTRFGIDVWHVLWADGSQGRYGGYALEFLGDVPDPEQRMVAHAPVDDWRH